MFDISGVFSTIIDKVVPDAKARDKAKLEMVRLQQSGEFRELDAAMKAIVAEANSEHKFVALARPAFLYVMYVFILSALPMGILTAFNPDIATNVTTGVHAWLSAIPESYLQLFGAGYLGYSGMRSYDKKTKKGK